MRAPLVPGNFTYCNFGGEASGGRGALNHLLVSASAAEIVRGRRSSDRLLSAVLIILEKNRGREFVEVDEEGMIDVGDAINGSADVECCTVEIGRSSECNEGGPRYWAFPWI